MPHGTLGFPSEKRTQNVWLQPAGVARFIELVEEKLRVRLENKRRVSIGVKRSEMAADHAVLRCLRSAAFGVSATALLPVPNSITDAATYASLILFGRCERQLRFNVASTQIPLFVNPASTRGEGKSIQLPARRASRPADHASLINWMKRGS